MSVQGSLGDYSDERKRLVAAFKRGEKAVMSIAPRDVWDSALWQAMDDLRRAAERTFDAAGNGEDALADALVHLGLVLAGEEEP